MKELWGAAGQIIFKSDSQEKSSKILISWLELKNQFFSFFLSIDTFQVDKNIDVDCSSKKHFICKKN